MNEQDLKTAQDIAHTLKTKPAIAHEVKNYFETDERAKFSIEHITAQKSKELSFDKDFEEQLAKEKTKCKKKKNKK